MNFKITSIAPNKAGVSAKTGKPWKQYAVKFQETGDKAHYIFGTNEMEKWEAGMTVELEEYDNEYNGVVTKQLRPKKIRFADIIKRIEALEKRMDKIQFGTVDEEETQLSDIPF